MVAFGIALLIAAAVVVALRERQPAPPPDVPVAASPAEVRVKAVERKSATVARANAATASRAVARRADDIRPYGKTVPACRGGNLPPAGKIMPR